MVIFIWKEGAPYSSVQHKFYRQYMMTVFWSFANFICPRVLINTNFINSLSQVNFPISHQLTEYTKIKKKKQKKTATVKLNRNR